ncbi:MAG: M15 family metallopeptidase [Defluviitaleaceae bacterium]|nr:M15 family metallopeptidase [Defluviitaleaceae bacterium]
MLLIFTLAPIATYAADSQLLWLVNRDNALPSIHQPPNLTTHNGIKLRQEARDAFVTMLGAMEAAGVPGLRLQSAYRSYAHQQAVFNQRVGELQRAGYIRREAEQKAALSVQPPGASEHQLGLALDVSIDGKLTQAFGETAAGQWLAAHCHNYGFIIRYPQDKSAVTGIVYEPWHLRYVGAPHAAVMHAQALALEEYATYMQTVQMYVVWEDDGYFLLSYNEAMPAQAADMADISSTGPGRTGYIATLRRTGSRK